MTVRLVADEHIARRLVVGLRRVVEAADIVRVQDVGLRTADDSAILQWAADEGRILVSHDLRTIPGFAADRLAAGLSMPGVILLRASLPIATAIDELALVIGASDAEEWDGLIAHLPLQ